MRLTLVVAALCVWSFDAQAATVRPGFVEELVASGLQAPTAMAFAPDGRLFVCQQAGQLRVIKDGVLLAQPFVQVTVNAAGERGLLGVAFDPNFPAEPYVYVYYTATSPTIHNRVSRFTAAGDAAVPGSEAVLLDLPTLSATNHNGGAIHFGPDGYLYIGVGENAVALNAQSLSSPLGKMLRIARDGSIPDSNPFAGQTSGINRAIWAIGLRNPFTFAIDPLTGRMLVNDVGQDAWEEINEGIPGANYGWPAVEGPASDPRFTGPLHAYSQAATGGCAVTGAAFYPSLPSAYPPEFAGHYFFADLCAGWIRHLDPAGTVNSANFASGIVAPVDLAIGPEGSLYYLARGGGASSGLVARIDVSGSVIGGVPTPQILAPSGAQYTAGTMMRFVGAGSDREDGRLPASAFTWHVMFHHSGGERLILGPVSGVTRGSFPIPNTGNASPNVFYRIHLTVTDSSGQSATTHRDVRPLLASVRVVTSAPGLAVTISGQTVVAPDTFRTVLGMRLVVEAVEAQSVNGARYEFRSWSDGGAPSHVYIVRARSATLVASYRRTGRDDSPHVAPSRACAGGAPCSARPTGRTARPR